jgi:anti-anti-sigma factor
VAQIEVEKHAGTLVVGLRGEIGAALVRPLRTALEAAFGGRGGYQVVVDMAAVTRCDTPAWAVLVATSRRLSWVGGGLRLVDVSAPVLAALRSTGLHRLVNYVPAPPTQTPVQADGAA